MPGRLLLALFALCLNGCASVILRVEPGSTNIYPGALAWSTATIDNAVVWVFGFIDLTLCIALDTLLLPLDIALRLIG